MKITRTLDCPQKTHIHAALTFIEIYGTVLEGVDRFVFS